MKYSMPKHIAVAIAGGVLAVSLGAGVIFLGQGSENDPADILPAAQTLALVRNADRASMLTLQRYVVGFDSIALPDHPVDVALLGLPNGSPAWAIFDAKAAPVGMRFSISASDASVQGMIGEGESRLSEQQSYGDLKAYLRDGPSAYLRFPGVALKPATSISSLFAPLQPVAIQFKADAMRITLPEGDAIESLSSALLPSVRTLVQSRIRTIAASLFGFSISPAYDLAQLMHTSAFIYLQNESEIILVGRAAGASQAKNTVSRLHEAFAAHQPGVEVVNLPLDDQFSYTGIRKADSGVQTINEERDGFSIVRSHTDTAMFSSALQGSSVVLSNTMGGLSAGMIIAADGSPFRSKDHFSFAADLPSLRKHFPFLNATESVQWVSSYEDGRLVLEIPR